MLLLLIGNLKAQKYVCWPVQHDVRSSYSPEDTGLNLRRRENLKSHSCYVTEVWTCLRVHKIQLGELSACSYRLT